MIEIPIWLLIVYLIFGAPIYMLMWIVLFDLFINIYSYILDKFGKKFKNQTKKINEITFLISEYSTTLEDCPIGLFVSENILCLKTEYGNNEGRIDCYIVSSGEFFWGNNKSVDELRKEIVYPVRRII